MEYIQILGGKSGGGISLNPSQMSGMTITIALVVVVVLVMFIMGRGK